MLNPGSEVTLVVGLRQLAVRVTPIGPPQTLSVTIVDGESTWTFDQPGWRPIQLGTGPLGAFLWSAREVIVLPSQINEAPTVAVVVDEDLLAVFRDPDGWTLVCETSVRRHIDERQVQRIELGAVIESFTWRRGNTLAIRLDDRSELAVAVDGAQRREVP